jgi:hypothetical protein
MNPEHPAFKNFSGRKIRNKSNDGWLYAVVDFIQFAIGQDNYQKARKYWNKLKSRLIKEGEPILDKLICHKLIAADGKQRITDVADLETLIEIIRLTLAQIEHSYCKSLDLKSQSREKNLPLERILLKISFQITQLLNNIQSLMGIIE